MARSHLLLWPSAICLVCAALQPRNINLVPEVARDQNCPVILKPQTPMEESRIIGGAPSGPYLTSSFVILYQTGIGVCTGILVASTVVLFSARCNFNLTVKVYIGYRSSSWDDNSNNFSRILRHSSFINQAPEYDLAYGVLTSSISENVTAIKVNGNKSYPEKDSYVRHAGYGYLSEGETDNNFMLYQVDAPVSGPESCEEDRSSYSKSITDGKLFCSGYKDRDCRKCEGDGPVIQYDKADDPVLVGFGALSDCSESNLLDLDIRIATLTDFLPNSIEITTDVVQVKSTGSELPAPRPSSSPRSKELPSNVPLPDNEKVSVPLWAVFGTIVGGAVIIIFVIVLVFRVIKRTRPRQPSNLQDF